MSGGDILFLAHRVPFPPDKGDKIRAWHFLRHLAGRARVHLACFVDDPADRRHLDELRCLCARCHFAPLDRAATVRRGLRALATGEPISVARLRDPGMAGFVRSVLAEEPVGCAFAFSSGMAPYLELAEPGVRRVVDFVDVDAEKWRALAERRRGPARLVLAREGARLLAFDRAAAARADACLFVSCAEADRFAGLAPAAADRLEVVPNGVDTVAFRPGDAHGASPTGGGPRIVMTGDMRYGPNADGAAWFAREILPRVRAERPSALFTVVGRAPTRAVRRLATLPGVDVTGTVPDTRPYLQSADVVVAPLRLAFGVPNKVLEAMATGRPVVATAATVRGLDLRSGVELLVADTAEAFAGAVTALFDPARARAVGSAARRRVVADFGWPAALARLDEVVGGRAQAARGVGHAA